MSLQQTGNAGHFNDVLTAHLTGTGGALAQYSSYGGTLLTFDIATTHDLMNLASGVTFSDGMTNGELSTTPEPGTFVMLGCGLLAVGGYLRRKVACVYYA